MNLSITRGPWQWHDERNCDEDSFGAVFTQRGGRGHSITLADVPDLACLSDDEKRANLCAMAAVPDLLKACARWLSYVDEYRALAARHGDSFEGFLAYSANGGHLRAQIDEAEAEIRQAVAKAQGKAVTQCR